MGEISMHEHKPVEDGVVPQVQDMPERMVLESMDIAAEKREQLKQLFPEVFNEDKVDFERLQRVLGEQIDTGKERYGLTWPGKAECMKVVQEPSRATLKPCREESVNFDDTENLFIEGDNLEVLKLLQKSYFGKVKMIYIDPPYNTGKEFIYPDNFQETIETYLAYAGLVDANGKKFSTNTPLDGRYHTNWLNMILPRLYLSKNLMREDGLIFISIDDHEIKNLRTICDEFFGPENFVEQLIWKSGRTSASYFTREHEYILVYAKNINSLNYVQYVGGDALISDRAIKKVSTKNPASNLAFPKGLRFVSDDKKFPTKFGGNETVEVISGTFECKDGKLANDVVLRAGWTMKSLFEKWIKGEEVYDTKGQRIVEFFFKNNGVLQYVKERATEHPKSIITDFTTKQGGVELTNLGCSGAFDYPKPVGLIKHLLKFTKDDDLILDFFAGSGTTSHAVYAMNAEDNANRRFISVQLPEPCDGSFNTIADLCKERTLRAA